MNLTVRSPIMVSSGLVAAYALAFVLLHPVIGDGLLPLTLVPILTVSWLHGLRGAMVIAPAMVVLDLVLFTAVGDPAGMFSPISLVGHAMVALAALATGRFSKINADQRRYLVERTQLVEELRRGEGRYRTLFEQAGDGVFIVRVTADGGARFSDCNQRTITLFGCESRDEIVGRSPADFSPERQPDGELSLEKIGRIARASIGGTPQVFEWQHRRQDGSLFWVEVSLTPVALGSEPTLQAIVRDIGDRKLAEEQRVAAERQLRQAQKMEALGVLAGGVAHEFNNLLVPILGHVDLLRSSEGSSPEDDRKQLDVIERAALRASELIRQMLAYGRKSMSERTSVQLGDTVTEAVQFIESTLPENLTVRVVVDDGLPPVRGTASELVQVLLNLCLNASHAMPGGGDLTIRAEDAGKRTFRSSTGEVHEGRFLSLSVEDTGTGMDESVVTRIFDPFFTTKEVGEGSGLGLSVVQGIVEQHGGHVEVASRVGEGTRFDVYLPVTELGDALSDERRGPGSQSRGGRVLVVDDEPMVLDLTCQMLEFLGFESDGARDGREALEQFRSSPDEFELVIADYGMPGMNGREFAAAVREIRQDVPIVICSGYGDVLASEDAASWEVDGLLTKPFQVKDLSAALDRVLPARTNRD